MFSASYDGHGTALIPVKCTLNDAHFSWQSWHCTVHTAQCAVCSANCIMKTDHCAPISAPQTLQRVVYTAKFTLTKYICYQTLFIYFGSIVFCMTTKSDFLNKVTYLLKIQSFNKKPCHTKYHIIWLCYSYTVTMSNNNLKPLKVLSTRYHICNLC